MEILTLQEKKKTQKSRAMMCCVIPHRVTNLFTYDWSTTHSHPSTASRRDLVQDTREDGAHQL